MRYLIKLVSAALLVTTSGGALGEAASTLPSPRTAVIRVAAVARAAGLAGEIMVVDANGQSAGTVMGLADHSRGTRHRRGQRWLWASVTKQVTAVLVMQEVEHGRLELDASVGRYLPAYAGRNITLRQLLQHQSGLPNPVDTPVDGDDVQTFYRETGTAIGDAQRARGFCAGAVKRAPGGKFEYNNCDYQVLGAVLQAVTGKQYGALVEKRIAQALGIKTLREAADGALGGGADVTGYSGGKLYPAINIATAGAAGALVGSANDLATFDRALMNGRLVSAKSRATLWAGNPKLGYEGLGVWSFPALLKGCAKPVNLIERRGDFGGTQARNIIAPDLNRALIVFVNDDAIDFGEIWQGKGLSYDLLASAFCQAAR